MIGWPEAVEERAVDLDAGGVAVAGGVVPLASEGGGTHEASCFMVGLSCW
jgi:hypothetical protein